MTVKGGINGFGRMGRLLVRALSHHPNLELVHVNEIHGDVNTAAHLMQFDSVHGTWKKEAKSDGKSLFINGKEVAFTDRYLPAEVPWAEREVSMVFECTGTFRSFEDLLNYFDQDIKKVVVAAPVHDERALNVVMGCNDHLYDKGLHDVVTAASCTTNCLAPIAKVLNDNFGIESGLMTTVHAATSSQKIVDSPSRKDWRGGRAAFSNIIPSSTGAAKAVGKVIPSLDGKLTGMAFRVPTVDVSVVDLTVNLVNKTSYDEICDAMKKASQNDLNGILGYTNEPVVSTDFMGDSRTSIFDAGAGIMLNETFVKLVSWYDNEWGYSSKVIELIEYMNSKDN